MKKTEYKKVHSKAIKYIFVTQIKMYRVSLQSSLLHMRWINAIPSLTADESIAYVTATILPEE